MTTHCPHPTLSPPPPPPPSPSQLLTHRCLVELALFADRPCLGSLASPTPVTICLSLLLQELGSKEALWADRPGDHSTPEDILTSASSPGDMCWMDPKPPDTEDPCWCPVSPSQDAQGPAGLSWGSA